MVEVGNIKLITLPESESDSSLVQYADNQQVGLPAHQMPKRQQHPVGRAVPLPSDQLEMQQTLLPDRKNLKNHDASVHSLQASVLSVYTSKICEQAEWTAAPNS